MKRVLNVVSTATLFTLFAVTSVNAASFEQPNATAIIKKDMLAGPTVYMMPEGCISKDPAVIARGKFIFHNLNGKKAKKSPPAGLARKQMKAGKTYLPGDKIPAKQYGNCVACHNIEGARGAGNIGPDLSGYKGIFMDSGVRNNQFVYQKIADPRVENSNTHMTVNLTSKLFTQSEICDITSYIVSPK